MPRTRLLALDLDGTLYRDDRTISPWDIEAVARAREAGVTVTIATGRIAHGALPAARELGLTTPLVCAEGAVIVDPASGDTLLHRALDEGHVEWFTHTAGSHGLAPFWFLHDEIHGEEDGRDHVGYVGTWSPSVTLHDRLRGSRAWPLRSRVTMAVALGRKAAVEAAHAAVEAEHGGKLMVARFPIGPKRETWTLLVRDLKVDKATGLSEVAAKLGMTAHDVACVGDWVNDIPMFRWARRSFAMGQSPDYVAEHATERLTATSATGGGVAEAVRKILAEDEDERG